MNIEDQRDWWITQSKDWKALCDFQTKRIYRLKLERLMWKAKHKSNIFYQRASRSYTNELAEWEDKRSERWYDLYKACDKKLEELK